MLLLKHLDLFFDGYKLVLEVILIKYLLIIALFLSSSICFAQDTGFDQSWNNRQIYLRPYRPNAYGPGINSDATGRPFQWQTEDRQPIEPWNRVKPDAYGPGIGMDQYGRPVKPGPGN